MDKALVEITKEEAEIIPLLMDVKLTHDVKNGMRAYRVQLLAEGLIQKVQAAFQVQAEAAPVEMVKPKRKRH